MERFLRQVDDLQRMHNNAVSKLREHEQAFQNLCSTYVKEEREAAQTKQALALIEKEVAISKAEILSLQRQDLIDIAGEF
tara:strand:- start:2170 stop:2409 length:240 start_codon:yes stop_codon:yes gene_type:complete